LLSQRPDMHAHTPLANMIWKELDQLEKFLTAELKAANLNPGTFRQLNRQAQKYSLQINCLREYIMLTQMD